MTDEIYRRKLTAILSADVAGYSRLMGDDEIATVSTLKSHRELITENVKALNGRVVDSPGDNILSEFRSIVDAVKCAVAIQEGLREKNDKLPENRKMNFRIGVNLGDVIQDGDRIYGDGVNIAARIEGLADPGGVAISGTAFDSIRNKLECGYQFSGEHAVKNIANPIRVYKILTNPECAGKVIGEKRFLGRMSRKVAIAVILASIVIIGGLISYYIYLHQSGRIEPAAVEKMAFPLPGKPSIAVLPFKNLSDDPAQDKVVDGITDNIITLLSKVPRLFVISRNSSFAYKDKPMKVQQVAEDLGVQYVLEGSVQRSSDQVRITAQLVDALEGHQLWSERYDRQFKDVFSIQDELALSVVSAMRVLLSEGEQARVVRGAPRSVEAWELYLQADVEFKLWSKESEAKARELLQRALALDPDYVEAWDLLAGTHLVDARFGYSDSREKSWNAAEETVARILSVDDTNSRAYGTLRAIYLQKGEHDKAIAMGEKSQSLNPNNSDNLAGLAWTMFASGRPEEALYLIRQAMRLNPIYPDWWLMILEESYRLSGRYDEAIETIREELRRLDNYFTRTRLALYYAQTGRDDKARAEIARVLELRPDMNLDIWANAQFFKDQSQLERDLSDLRRVGLPEKTPLPLPAAKQN
jgi:adenylate cyclase